MNTKEIFAKYPNILKLKYTSFYQRHFSNLSPKLLLEIGVASGDSLRAWKDIFPECKIIGLDINPACRGDNPDLNIYIGNQKDTNLLTTILNKEGIPDIIIDDGGHKRSEQVETFKFLFPKLTSNSLYIIEDLQTNYLSNWNDQEYTIMNCLKSLLSPKGYLGGMGYSYLAFEPTQGQAICILRK